LQGRPWPNGMPSTEAELRRRKAIMDELEEWIRALRVTIQLKEYRKQTDIEVQNRVILKYNKDLAFNLMILYKFGAREERG
jgi:hypothetical protein